MKKYILLIEDDPNAEATIREALGREYQLETVKKKEEAETALQKKKPDLLLIDFDLKGTDGLQVYRELYPSIKTIMISASGNVPLAVMATKQGVADFLRKPINAEELRNAVSRVLSAGAGRITWPAGTEWLKGAAPKVAEDKDILLIGERGIPRDKVAEFIHVNSSQRAKKFVAIDLTAFSRENMETHFWATIKRVLSGPEANSVQREEDLCGTLFLDNLESIDEYFRITIADYFKKGKKSARVILGAGNRNFKFDAMERVEILPLRERKQDLPFILGHYLRQASARWNKPINFISTDVLEFMAGYDLPGNYLELQAMVEEAVLAADKESLELKNFPLSYRALLSTSVSRMSAEELSLEEARAKFETKLYQALLAKTGGDASQAARFMDVPKALLAERLQDLLH